MALVDAERRFAKRTAQWLMKSKMSRVEIAHRLTLFPKDFVSMINEEATKLRGGTPPPTA